MLRLQPLFWIIGSQAQSYKFKAPLLVCEVCCVSFTRQGDFIFHKRSMHSIDDNNNKANSMVCPFEKCGRRFIKETPYQDHLNVHTGLKPYRCGNCNQCFTCRYAKQRHEQHCFEKKSYDCSVCRNSYTRKYCLDAHYSAKHSGATLKCHCGR